MKRGFCDDIDRLTVDNEDFRRVLYTGKHLQLVLMTLQAGEEIGAEVHEDRDQFFRFEEGTQFFGEPGFVLEGVVGRARLQEEVERVDARDVGDQVDLNAKLGRRLLEDQPRQEVALRILLPVNEVLGRRDLQRIAGHRRARVGGWAEPHHLRTQIHRTVVPVVGHMV